MQAENAARRQLPLRLAAIALLSGALFVAVSGVGRPDDETPDTRAALIIESSEPVWMLEAFYLASHAAGEPSSGNVGYDSTGGDGPTFRILTMGDSLT